MVLHVAAVNAAANVVDANDIMMTLMWLLLMSLLLTYLMSINIFTREFNWTGSYQLCYLW